MKLETQKNYIKYALMHATKQFNDTTMKITHFPTF